MPRSSKTKPSSNTVSRKGGVLSAVLAFVSLVIVGSVGVAFFPRLGMQPVAPEPADLKLVLYRAGLKPEFLAAAGVSPSQVRTVVANMRTHLSTAMPRIEQADSSYAAAKRQVDQLRRLVRQGKATSEQVSDLATAKSALDTATSQRDALIEAAFDAAAESLGTETVALLSIVRANDRKWDLPTPFLTVNRTEAEWLNIRDALANQRISEDLGTEPNPDLQTLLGQANANATVAAATQRLQNLNEITTAWENEAEE